MKFLVLLVALINIVNGALHATQAQLNHHIGGVYINNRYKMVQLNNWHFVEIKSIKNDVLLWTNKAGVKWTMTVQVAKNTKDNMFVGFTCGKNPYYAKGFKAAVFVFPKNNSPVSVFGPFKEPYVQINHLI